MVLSFFEVIDMPTKREVAEHFEILNKKSNLVVKHNDLIQKTRFSLSVQEQKIILYCISKLKPDDEDFKRYTVDLKSLCNICGIEEQGKNYLNFRKNIEEIKKASFYLKLFNGKNAYIDWLIGVEYDDDNLGFSFSFDNRLKPYLLQLQKSFTAYELANVLNFKSKYSIRLYELLKSFAYRKNATFSLEQLKELLMIGNKYKQYKYFRTEVLEKAVKEINTFTDIRVSYTPHRENRKITELDFLIES